MFRYLFNTHARTDQRWSHKLGLWIRAQLKRRLCISLTWYIQLTLISVLVLLGLSIMPPKVLCECGCGLFVSVHTVRRNLEGKARPHIRASTGRWDPVSVGHTPSIHSQNSAPSETCIVAHSEPVLVPQDAHDISEPMDWSAADSPVRSMSCEPGSPEQVNGCSSERFIHLAKSLRAGPLVESDDEDNLRRSPSPTSESDSEGHLSSSEDEDEDMAQPDGLSAWDALGERFEQDLADIGASKAI